jgi:hypothetical protein
MLAYWVIKRRYTFLHNSEWLLGTSRLVLGPFKDAFVNVQIIYQMAG